MVVNSTILRDQLDQLLRDLDASTSIANTTESLLGGASETLDNSEALLGESEGAINSSRSRLTVLRGRLSGLEVQIEQNEFELRVARNLTASAVLLADEAELVSGEVELCLKNYT